MTARPRTGCNQSPLIGLDKKQNICVRGWRTNVCVFIYIYIWIDDLCTFVLPPCGLVLENGMFEKNAFKMQKKQNKNAKKSIPKRGSKKVAPTSAND